MHLIGRIQILISHKIFYILVNISTPINTTLPIIYYQLLMKITGYIVVLTILLYSCKSKESINLITSAQSFVKLDSFEIQTGFTPSLHYSGYLQDGDSEYVYLANLLVHDTIHFYTYPELKKRKNIALKEVLDLGYEFYNVHIFNLDSIMLLGRYHNIMFTINDKGEIIHKKNLEPFCDADSFHVNLDFLNDINQNLYTFNNKKYLLLNASNISLKPNLETKIEDWHKFFKSPFIDPTLAMYSFSDHTLKIDSLSLFRPLNPDGRKYMISMFWDNCRFRDNILIISLYSDTLYILNPEHLTLENKIPLKFSGGKLGMEGIPISNENFLKEIELTQENRKKGGYAQKIFTDRKNKNVFIEVLHPRTKKEIEQNKQVQISFLVLDSNLNQIDEEPFRFSNINPNFIIPVSNGFLISIDDPKNPNFNENKARFALFRYE